MESPLTVWVVVRPDSDRDRVQELGYFSRADAEKRANHINADNAYAPKFAGNGDERPAEVWPVTLYLDKPEPPTRAPLPGSTVATVSRGVELTAYEMPERRFSMASVLAAAEALSPKERGALTEALLGAPGTPLAPFEEHGGQLRLFPRDLP